MRSHLVACAATALVAGAGCSDPFPTDWMYADLSFRNYGDGLKAHAAFKRCEEVPEAGGAFCMDPIGLDGGDHLWARVDGEWLEFGSPVGDPPVYELEVPELPYGSKYRIALDRDDATSATNSITTVPPSFSFSGAPETMSRATDGLELELVLPSGWDEDPYVSEFWSCGRGVDWGNNDWQFDLTENRAWIEPGTFEVPDWLEQNWPGEDCTVSLSVSLSEDGTRDPAFGAGHIRGEQRRTLYLESTP